MSHFVYKIKNLEVVTLAQQFGNELSAFRVIKGFYIVCNVSEDELEIISHENKIVKNKGCEIKKEGEIFAFNKMPLSEIINDRGIITKSGINKFEKEYGQEDDLSKIIENPKVELCK